jgi:hypothetical protein
MDHKETVWKHQHWHDFSQGGAQIFKTLQDKTFAGVI